MTYNAELCSFHIHCKIECSRHDLTKELSYFLFFFCFVLFYLVRSLLKWSVGKYHVTVTESQKWSHHSHNT